MSEHTFVICAYRESPYLEECIQSLRGTDGGLGDPDGHLHPNEFVRQMAEHYDIPLHVNPGPGELPRTGISAIPKLPRPISPSPTRTTSIWSITPSGCWMP